MSEPINSTIDALPDPDGAATWRFTLTPRDQHRLPERFEYLLRYIAGKGIDVANLTLSLHPRPNRVDEDCRVAKVLKAALRDCQLRASWPGEDGPGVTIRPDPDVRGVGTADASEANCGEVGGRAKC
jgi:hypothetical protein